MIEELEEYRDINKDKIKEFINYLKENNLESYIDSIIDDETINNIVKNEIEENGWESVHNKLSQISSTNKKYYFVDGYDNFRNLCIEDINNIIDEIIKEKSLKI